MANQMHGDELLVGGVMRWKLSGTVKQSRHGTKLIN